MDQRRTLKRFDANNVARFLTFSCYRNLPLLGHQKIRDHFMSHFCIALTRQAVHPVAWVVMPNHVHLVVLPCEANAIPSFLISLKRNFSMSVLKRWREMDAAILNKIRCSDGTHRFWQTGGGYDRILSGNELAEKIRYIHANPLRGRLCQTSTAWAWSSARQYAGVVDEIGPEINFALISQSDRP